jgi:hypothetical protein
VIVSGLAAAAILGATDGVAASADTIAGRHWDTTGMSLSGGPIIEYGWAPATQAAGALLGTALLVTGHRDAGIGFLGGSVTLMSRAFGFKLAQRRSATPAPTQG